RPAGSTTWVPRPLPPMEWRERALAILEQAAASTPGSLVEHKTVSLAWHYRMADPEFGAAQANELRLHLTEMLSNLPVEIVAREPFHFWTRLTLSKLTGRRAVDLAELVEHLRVVPLSVVFQHTHHFLVQHQYLSPEPPNDFAFWVTNVLQEDELGERLAAIDTVSFEHLRELRDRIMAVIEGYLEPRQALRTAPAGEEFHFMDAVSFVLPTRHRS